MKTSNQVQLIFGSRIRQLRLLKGLSQEELSFQCGLDRTYISQVELGRRNISLQNIKALADALEVAIVDLFSEQVPVARTTHRQPQYSVNNRLEIECGFKVTGQDIALASSETAKQLELLPFTLFQSIDLKTLSSIVGAVFVSSLADRVGAIVNPIEKGHPDIVPLSARQASEAQLRNYPQGLEVKTTLGNVRKGSNLPAGIPRIDHLLGITWQAHHREVASLLGLVIDFSGNQEVDKRYPIVTGAFFANNLTETDWGEISGTTGRNTKVTGMRTSGRQKMGQGWAILLDSDQYILRYSNLLSFKPEG